MSSPDFALVVIACPHCRTRYQVPPTTLGADGRDVQCAHCGKSWFATPPGPAPASRELAPAATPQTLPGADEDQLDRLFEATAREVQPQADAVHEDIETFAADLEADKAVDPTSLRKSHKDFARRQELVSRGLPTAKIRRTARLAAILLLAGVIIGGFSQRQDLVRWFPSLAAVYAGIGLPVNVAGLEFTEPKTVMTVRNGNAVLQVAATIRSVALRSVPVPPVLVTLLDMGGNAVYEWTVLPQARIMAPGESLALATEVNAPPGGAARVRLSFTTSSGSAAPTKVS